MSFAFIPVPAENPLFNEKTVNEKWNKFMDKLCSDIITTLDLKTSDISKNEISDIITENLNKHYFIQPTSTSTSTSKTSTPTKEVKSKKTPTHVSDNEEEEEEITPPTPTKTKTKIKTIVKKQPEPESEPESEKEEEVLKPKKELKKSKEESVKEESEKLDKDRCSEILKNNSQCKGKAVLGSTLCSRHNKKSK